MNGSLWNRSIIFFGGRCEVLEGVFVKGFARRSKCWRLRRIDLGVVVNGEKWGKLDFFGCMVILVMYCVHNGSINGITKQ